MKATMISRLGLAGQPGYVFQLGEIVYICPSTNLPQSGWYVEKFNPPIHEQGYGSIHLLDREIWNFVRLSPFVEGYFFCMLWIHDEKPGQGAYEKTHSFENEVQRIDKASLVKHWEEVNDFELANSSLLSEYEDSGYSMGYAGHDFYLSRNGHGAGFWDRGLGEIGDKLHKAAKVYGESNEYVGDDGLIYIG